MTDLPNHPCGCPCLGPSCEYPLTCDHASEHGLNASEERRFGVSAHYPAFADLPLDEQCDRVRWLEQDRIAKWLDARGLSVESEAIRKGDHHG